MLAPGDYHLGVWIGSAVASGETFIHLDVLTLRIWPDPGDRHDVERTRRVQPPVEWEMRQAAAASAVIGSPSGPSRR
jgi:hypothetical protein